MFVPALLVAAAAPQTPTPFPRDVVVPTPTEAIGLGEIYAVRGGKLWMKRAAGSWELYGGTGAPPGTDHPVIAVFADEDEHFTVVTDDLLMHHHENGAWDSLWGLPSLPPVRGPLALPFATASLRPGRAAYSMRQKNVLFYEDRNGAQFFWGDAGTTSLFVLTDDGRRILFGDPWLPPDFSREICAPERGGFVMASVAASASMLFVIGVDGSMFTRFEDYDHDGGTPLFSYDYRPERSARPPPVGRAGTDPLSAAQTRGLPADDWHAQPPVALSGKARLSRNIAIVQTGRGNAARELRVAGDDADGRRGVYAKPLDAARWTFRPAGDGALDAGLDVAAGAWLDPRAQAHAAAPSVSYGGFLRMASSSVSGARRARGKIRAYGVTDDFAFHCSPFHLTLDVGGVDVPLLVHAVDAWTLFSERDPVDDDTAGKRYKITLFLDEPAGAAPLPAETRAALDDLFRGALGRPFAFAGVANQHELVIVPVSYPLDVARARWSLVMRSNPAERALAVVPLHPASHLAARILAAGGAGAGATLADVRRDGSGCRPAVHARAARALVAVRAARDEAERRLLLSRALEAALPSGTAVVDVGTVVTSLRFTWPLTGWLDSLELHLPAVLGAPVLAYERFVDGSRADFDATEHALAACAGAAS